MTTVITEKHIDTALAAAEAGELNGHKYDQSRWCGTACCVLGFARLAAGSPEANKGPQPGEIEDTPRAQRIAALMMCPSPDVLRIMRLVGPDGRIADLTGADLTGANLARANLTGANLTGADLTDADLTGANLTGADLTDADLTDANLTDANLTDARISIGNVTRRLA